jgi:hypothetical protein
VEAILNIETSSQIGFSCVTNRERERNERCKCNLILCYKQTKEEITPFTTSTDAPRNTLATACKDRLRSSVFTFIIQEGGGSTSIVGVVFGTYLHEQHRHTHLKKAHVKLVDSMGGNGRIEWPCMHAETQHLE